MVDVDPTKKPSPPLVALCGWLVPGLGYWLIGEKTRALYSGGAILTLFLGSLLVAGVRTIDVPGYDYRGERILTADGSWVLLENPVRSLLNTPHFIPEFFAGPITFISAYAANVAGSEGVAKTNPLLDAPAELGCAVAGGLNLMALIDAASRAARRRRY
ncbi:MAG: DUF6677 family protein [Planctomycetota bacterium]